MAEVRKKIVKDTYNTSKIKKKEKNETKKEIKRVDKKAEKETEKKSLLVKFRIFCHGVKSEFEKVHWPSKKDMIKYSIATIFFIVSVSVFFYLIDVIFALVQSLFA